MAQALVDASGQPQQGQLPQGGEVADAEVPQVAEKRSVDRLLKLSEKLTAELEPAR